MQNLICYLEFLVQWNRDKNDLSFQSQLESKEQWFTEILIIGFHRFVAKIWSTHLKLSLQT